MPQASRLVKTNPGQGNWPTIPNSQRPATYEGGRQSQISGYYDPIPGRYYGGVRIKGAPREARVFADGYYVGIVDDFDGIFQHINLETGPHHIEIEEPGFRPIAFDVYVRPGETITFRADRSMFY